ncbi:secA regulator SecM [Affinibrenneria salicis]|uniref:Secretion monitor n=1 Tax=Affinibrenneria salicis TaxID=2590031 RepID=A0A5J5G6D0_9GAMM|nr:secA translation cis-regulator SecM [Affinibrenneria salicis]KAA9002594.1 secA regulator SecM [Affinibrenneria salicis]KAA9003118.1 secA regulator SecM [Affinibrenneria salicis]
MIGILNRWRQFGRRYFWPHLLLGMVAASLGLPACLTDSQNQTSLSSTVSGPAGRHPVNLTALVSLKEGHRRAFSVDYWHQHAIRTVIRHLSFALSTPQTASAPAAATQLAADHHLVLLDTLNALLTHESKPPAIIRRTERAVPPAFLSHHTGLWLAQIQGIRAGPHTA